MSLFNTKFAAGINVKTKLFSCIDCVILVVPPPLRAADWDAAYTVLEDAEVTTSVMIRPQRMLDSGTEMEAMDFVSARRNRVKKPPELSHGMRPDIALRRVPAQNSWRLAGVKKFGIFF